MQTVDLAHFQSISLTHLSVRFKANFITSWQDETSTLTALFGIPLRGSGLGLEESVANIRKLWYSQSDPASNMSPPAWRGKAVERPTQEAGFIALYEVVRRKYLGIRCMC